MGIGRRAVPPWIFKHGTSIVDKGSKVLFFGFLLFFGLFSLAPSWKRLNSAIFGIFLLIFGFFPLLLGCRKISKNVRNETTKLFSFGNTFSIFFYCNGASYFTSDFFICCAMT